MPRIGYTILAIILALSSTFSIILNVTVIIVTLRYKQLRQPLNYALVNLAVADLGCAILGGLLTAVTNAMGYFSLGRVGCVLEGFGVAFFGKFKSFFPKSFVIEVQSQRLHYVCVKSNVTVFVHFLHTLYLAI